MAMAVYSEVQPSRLLILFSMKAIYLPLINCMLRMLVLSNDTNRHSPPFLKLGVCVVIEFLLAKDMVQPVMLTAVSKIIALFFLSVVIFVDVSVDVPAVVITEQPDKSNGNSSFLKIFMAMSTTILSVRPSNQNRLRIHHPINQYGLGHQILGFA